jgi:hypothetical protein
MAKLAAANLELRFGNKGVELDACRMLGNCPSASAICILARAAASHIRHLKEPCPHTHTYSHIHIHDRESALLNAASRGWNDKRRPMHACLLACEQGNRPNMQMRNANYSNRKGKESTKMKRIERKKRGLVYRSITSFLCCTQVLKSGHDPTDSANQTLDIYRDCEIL